MAPEVHSEILDTLLSFYVCHLYTHLSTRLSTFPLLCLSVYLSFSLSVQIIIRLCLQVGRRALDFEDDDNGGDESVGTGSLIEGFVVHISLDIASLRLAHLKGTVRLAT